jgi:hypothetical protein
MRKIFLVILIKLLSLSLRAEPELFNEYYLQITYSASTALGAAGVSIGTFMAATTNCLTNPDPALLESGFCIAGITIASVAGFVFVCGNAVAGACYLYNYYYSIDDDDNGTLLSN